MLISDDIVGWMSISQINGKLEKKTTDMHTIIGELLKFKMRYDANITPIWLWKQVEADECLNVSIIKGGGD